MSTSTPPPYFPQGSLMPPDPNRARKFKLTMLGCGLLFLLALAGAMWLLVHLFRTAR